MKNGGDRQTGININNRRIVRGGSWLDFPYNCRSACRLINFRDDRGSNIGARIAYVVFKTTQHFLPLT